MQKKLKLSPEEAARHVGVSVATLEKWRARRFGPPFGRAGRRIFYFEDDLSEWLAAQVVR